MITSGTITYDITLDALSGAITYDIFTVINNRPKPSFIDYMLGLIDFITLSIEI